MIKSRVLLISMLLLATLVFQGCNSNSDDSSENTQPLLGLTVVNKSTTVGDITQEELSNETEELISSALSRAFIKGAAERELFSEDALAKAREDFKDNTKATSNKARVSLYEMQTLDKETVVIVAELEHELVEASQTKKREGKIYFNEKGIIVGFDLTDFETREVVNSEA